MSALGLGIDFGGSGIKAALVDLDEGGFASERERVPTPHPATPDAVAEVMVDLVGRFPDYDGPVGVTVPGVVQAGVVRSAANIDRSWIGTDADALLSDRLGRAVHLVNDADAAGVAEARFGAARGRAGLVLLTTLGTGIGSALVVDGVLLPNSELGHLEVGAREMEVWAADSARQRDDLSWEQWAERLQTSYRTLEDLLWPDLFVVGGGVSKHADSFLPLLDLRTEIVPATLRNKAGIIGAALLAC